MARKLISLLLLVAIAAWAEMTLAPLLSLHGHAQMTAHQAENPPAAAPEHACCPKTHVAHPHVVPLYALTSAGLPCADQHRCCFRQGPQNAPTPVSDPNRISRDLAAVNCTAVISDGMQNDFADFRTSSSLGSQPGELSMVLRI